MARHDGEWRQRDEPALSAPGFVGRMDELGRMVEALSLPPALVLVEGEAGIGKSRLIEECLGSDVLSGEKILVSSCPPFRQPYTFGPVVDAVRQATDNVRGLPLSELTGALRPLFPEWGADLPPAPEPIADVTAARHRMFRAWLELFGALDVSMLVVEDAHWADEATLEFLLFLASRSPSPVSLVVTYRPEDLAADSMLLRLSSRPTSGATHARFTLQPLDAEQTAEFASTMLSRIPISAKFAEFLHRQTEGLPFALEELLRLLADRDDLTRRDGGWVRRYLDDIAVPATIRDAVLERFSRLSEPAQAVVWTCAVFTEPVAEASLVAATGLPADRASVGLTEALAGRLLTVDARGTVSFHHALACRAVYEAIPYPLRREIHRRAGRILEHVTPPPVGQLARHFREGRVTGSWSRYAEQAAEVSLASGDEAAAADVVCELLVQAELPARRVAELAAKVPLGPIYGTTHLDDLCEVLQSALRDQSLDSRTEAELRLRLGQVMSQLGDSDAGKAEIALAVDGLGHAPGRAALAMASLGMPLGLTWPATEHLAWVERAGRLTASLPAAEQLYITVGRMSALLLLGDASAWGLAGKIPDEPPTAQLRESVIRGQVNLADGCVRWGRYDEARERFAKAKALIDRDQYPHLVDLVQESERHLDWFVGDWTALADLQGLDNALEAGAPADEWRVETAVVAGLLQTAVGVPDRAERNLQAALRALRRSGILFACPEAAAALARIHLEAGHADDALSLTDGEFDIVVGKETWLWATELAPARVEALIALGRVEAAAEATMEFADGLRGRDIPAPRAGLTLCRGMVAAARGEHARAEVLFARAAARWEALPRPYDGLLARERRADSLTALGRHEECVADLRDVHRGLSDLGALAAAGRVERRLHELGVTVSRQARRGRRGYGDQLSPRELEVVRHVVAGRSNREIAEALFRSPKTVAAQLKSAMGKLGASSRTAVAVAAIDAGLVDPGERSQTDIPPSFPAATH